MTDPTPLTDEELAKCRDAYGWLTADMSLVRRLVATVEDRGS